MNHYYFLKFVWQFSILYDLFLSLVFAFIYLFVFVLYPYFWHLPNPTTDTMNLFYFLHWQQKTFPNFTIFFFYHLSLLLHNYQSTKNKQSNTTLIYSLISTNSTLSLSLSLYIYIYIYKIVEAERKWVATFKEVLTNRIIAYLKF